MAGFAKSFWSTDYAGGLGVIFAKLQQGVLENQQVLAVARLRAEAEELYADKVGDIEAATDRISAGFQRDDGASLRKAYEGVRKVMNQSSASHRKMGSNIRELVLNPFGRWCEAHEARVQGSQDDLQARLKAHDRQAELVKKLRSQYYNKCRLVEDLEEEDKLAFKEPRRDGSQSPQSTGSIPKVKLSEPDSPTEPETFEIGDVTYSVDEVKKVLSDLLSSITLGEAKVPVLGVYQNVSTGTDITDAIQRKLNTTNVAHAEKVGQDLVATGFLRLVGNVGSTFANSSKMNYQWRPKAFELTDIPEKKKPLERTMTNFSMDSIDNQFVAGVGEYIAGWNPLSNAHGNETAPAKLRREVREADDRYKAAVRKLDGLRCNLEEAIIDHLSFMERCELDRLKAIKAVFLDFSGAIGNVIPSLQSAVDSMMLYQETVQPLGDLRYLLENYRTGPFLPKVVTYENYYNTIDEQTYGVDLEARARADKKRVPVVVSTLLTFLDSHYPDLEGDEARRGIWLVDVPLTATHHVRAAINTGKAVDPAILDQYEVPIVASALKLYLLELPDSIVSSHVYEIIKTIYSTTAVDAPESARVSVIQSTLGQLRLANIATLDAIIAHFTRLIELTSAGEKYVATLATILAPCILRPRIENSLTMNERYSYRLIRDLLAHKDAIFGELKRSSSLSAQPAASSSSAAPPASTNPTTSTSSTSTPAGLAGLGDASTGRSRGVSTTEANRRTNMEERARAIAASGSRSRATSPAPHIRSQHRRDRSAAGPDTRFPVAIVGAAPSSSSPGSTPDRRSSVATNPRSSLEVPSSYDAPALVSAAADADVTASTHPNGASSADPQLWSGAPAPAATPSPASRWGRKTGGGGLARQSLIGKSGGVPGLVAGTPGAGEEHGFVHPQRPAGVELTDRPMED